MVLLLTARWFNHSLFADLPRAIIAKFCKDVCVVLNCEIAILAGGLSSRMGRDKTRLRLGGRTLLGHIRATASQLGFPVRVIRRDLVPRCGPLGGIYTALKMTRRDGVLFLSCDMPFISAELLHDLLNRVTLKTSALFVKSNEAVGFPFWLRRTVLRKIELQLAQNEFSLQTLARVLRAKIIRVAVTHQRELFNVNTLQDWELARQRWREANRIRLTP